MSATMLLVRCGDRRFAMELTHLVEVLDTGTAFPVPAAEPALRGLMDVRGRLVPLVHLGAFLSGGAPPDVMGDTAVLVRAGGGDVCLEVDEAETVTEAEALPAADRAEWTRGVVREASGLVPLLDLAAVVTRLTERGAVT